jgi:hypothetical protein
MNKKFTQYEHIQQNISNEKVCNNTYNKEDWLYNYTYWAATNMAVIF